MRIFSDSIAIATGILLLALQSPLIASAADGAQKGAHAPEIAVVDGSDKKQSIKLDKSDGTLDAEAHVIRLSIHFGDGKSGEGIIFVVYAPTAGVVWWEYQRLAPEAPSYQEDHLSVSLRNHRFYFLDDKIVGFHLQGTQIVVREGRERQVSFDAALQSIVSALRTNLHDVYGDPIPDRSQVPLVKPLGRDFFNGSKLVAQWRPSKLIDVARTGIEWTVTLEGPDGEHATVALSDDYKVKRAVRNGKEVFSASEPQP